MNNGIDTKKRLCLFTLYASLIFAGLYLALSALYSWSGANILYYATILPTVVDICTQLCNIAAYAVVFAALLYSVHSFGAKGTVPILCIYCAVLLLKNLANILIQSIIFSVAPSIADLLYVLLIWLLDVLMAAAVLLIGKLSLSKKRDEPLEFTRIYSPSNPLQTSALFVGVFISAIKIISRLIYDIGYGAPADLTELLRMIAAYISDVLVCAVVYLISNLVIKHFCKYKNM